MIDFIFIKHKHRIYVGWNHVLVY